MCLHDYGLQQPRRGRPINGERIVVTLLPRSLVRIVYPPRVPRYLPAYPARETAPPELEERPAIPKRRTV